MENTSDFICTITTIVDGKPPIAKQRLADFLAEEKNSVIIDNNNPNIARAIEFACLNNRNLVLDCSSETEKKE